MRLSVPILVLAAATAVVSAAQAQEPGNARRGEDYARRACNACHEVAPDAPAPRYSTAPSFAEIARIPGMTSMAINVWFASSHPSMPNFIIPEADRDDLLAYFAALRAAHKSGKADH